MIGCRKSCGKFRRSYLSKLMKLRHVEPSISFVEFVTEFLPSVAATMLQKYCASLLFGVSLCEIVVKIGPCFTMTQSHKEFLA